MHHSVCACLCVLAEAIANYLPVLWLQQWRLFLNTGRAPCPQQAATRTAARLSCQHSLCLPGIYLGVLLGCVCFCVRWIESVMHFFPLLILGWRAANDTQYTPLALNTNDLTCTYTQMSWGGDLFEDTQTTARVQEDLRNVRAITDLCSGMWKGAYRKNHKPPTSSNGKQREG